MKISTYFNIQRRFLRSANLERDFRDPSALDGYVATLHIEENVSRINAGLDKKSGQRAWRITGGYGAGKSSFALMLAQLYARNEAEFPSHLRSVLSEPISQVKRAGVSFLPVLVTGSREPMGASLVRGIARALNDPTIFDGRRVKLESAERAAALLRRPQLEDAQVIDLVTSTHTELVAKEVAEGILIVLDELGKFLEFAALHPGCQDVFLLQRLAELASRSGSSEPLFVVGLLHQGFSSYADLLSPSAQREWEKVAGRFEELFFDQPLEQVVHLVSAALGIKGELPRGVDTRSKSAMREAVDQGWYGPAAPVTSLSQVANSLYPLHPTVVPVIVKLFSRWGQNERSLFSFLLSREPFGLQAFSQQEASADVYYRLHNLYDYTAANFGHRLSSQGYRSNWNHIDSLVRSLPSRNESERAVLKTVGLLNLLNDPQFIPTEEAISLALPGQADSEPAGVDTILEYLHKDKHILYLRGKSGGYCLWSHTSVNLDAAYEEAGKALPVGRRVAGRIKPFLDTRPIVARRHYIQTGNLRCFDVVYCDMLELEAEAKAAPQGVDGRVVIPLCETAEEAASALRFARELTDQPTTLIGLAEPLTSLEGLVHEVERWTWVQRNTPELKEDKYAAEEVARRLSMSIQILERRIQHYVGVRLSSRREEMPVKWYYNGRQQDIKTGSGFLLFLSKLCDQLYSKSPRVHNELVNRRSISASASLARTKLIEGMFQHGDEEYLGMDPNRKPPEMAIYMSLLQAGKLHVSRQGRWRLVLPDVDDKEGDPCRLAPAIEHIGELLREAGEARVPVPRIFESLGARPFGIKDGLLPLLVAIYLRINWHRTALYEDGTYLHNVAGMDFMRLTKEPEFFDLQHCAVEGVRAEVYSKLMLALGIPAVERSAPDLLDVVRPLAKFVAQLPEYSRKTKSVSTTAVAVRVVLMEAREPANLLFRDLPKACGLPPFRNEGADGRPEVEVFGEMLRKAIQELQTSYDSLIERIEAGVLEAFGSQGPLKKFRASIVERCVRLKPQVTDPALKAFLFRLSDASLPRTQWLESLASHLVRKPAEHWTDSDETEFQHQLGIFAQKMIRVEALFFAAGEGSVGNSCRLVMTRPDGTEVVHVFDWDEVDAKKVTELERDLKEMLKRHGKAGLATAARVVWSTLKA